MRDDPAYGQVGPVREDAEMRKRRAAFACNDDGVEQLHAEKAGGAPWGLLRKIRAT